jgi:Arc/MetJ family transcription regulator
MRTSATLDDNLVNTAMRLSGSKTKKAVIEEGLRLLIQINRQKGIRAFRGKLPWVGNADRMRLD